jgi:DNA primase catalytic core
MSYIKQSFIEKLLDAAHIDVVIGKYVELKRAGANLKGKTPFGDERTGSFIVSPVKNIWKDFSTGKGGNLVSFVMEKESCTYPEAIKIIAGHVNMQVEYEELQLSEQQKERLEKKEQLRKTLESVWTLYQTEFKNLPEDHPAKIEVYQKRQYNSENVLDWGIGFAPENFLYDKLERSGKLEDGKALGLVDKSERGNKYDKYSNRVVYPIHDVNGLLIGLAGRDITDNKKTGKWINPNVNDKNILYNKSKVLYGLHKAKAFIRKRQEVFIVEGYNDVIGFHEYGLENTVAPCGTAITDEQINLLKKFTSKVVLCMDPDKAGMNSVLKYIPQLIKSGMYVEVIVLDVDPDDFTRKYDEIIGLCGGLEPMFKTNEIRQDGFKVLMNEKLQGSEIEISAAAKELCDLIATIKDEYIADVVYSKWLAKESKISISTIKKWVKDSKIENTEVIYTDFNDYEYELPKGVDIPFKELEADIKFYGMFMAKNRIWMALNETEDGKIRFASKSNFEIEVLNHMQDEKFPMKLIRIKNVHGLEKIFDTPSENLNTPQAFDNTMTGHGNFRFDGNRNDLLKLRQFLFDKMGNGRKIEVLGWQPEGEFWAWNNKITTIDGGNIELSENGIIIHKDIHYYIPSANKIYRNNSFKYDAQKRFRVIKNEVSFAVFMLKVKQVHRDHAISALLFGIASLFQDIVVEKLSNFPILFFFGPGSSGKDELAAIVQSFTGVPQTAINLEGNVSTIKAQVREFAQFRNGISQLSEYKNGNSQLDGMLKALWDRRGYKRGNLESHVGTESIPIESSAILTGNQFPNEEPLILRLIWNEMTKNEFNQDEMKAFDELRDMREKGVSCYSDELFVYRRFFQENFEKEQRSWKGILQELFPEAKGRITNNLSILASVYTMFKDKINFPFTQEEMIEHFRKGIDQQIRKINSASLLNRFWDCFLAGLRGPKESRLQVKYIVSIDQNNLYMQWTHTYNKVQMEWVARYKELAPSKSVLKEQIEKSGAYIEDLTAWSYDTGRDANRSSATVINLNALSEELKNDIIGSVVYQLNEGSLWDSKKEGQKSEILSSSKSSDGVQSDLPF